MNLEELEHQQKVLNKEYKTLIEVKKGIHQVERYCTRINHIELMNNVLYDMIKNREAQTECLKQQLLLLNK